jgi:monoamine oxidase
MALWQRLDHMARAEPRDLAFAATIDTLRDNPWTASVEAWEACQIAAADPRDFSVQDWRINALEGINLTVPRGLGAFVARHLGARAGPVSLATPVHAIDWRGPIVAETPHGSIRADACIITTSTAALANIRVSPALPVSADGLPMGLLTKVAFRATGPDRLDVAADCSVTARIAPGEAMLSMFAWPGGADHVVCFIGGPPAWELCRDGRDATIDFARARLRAWFGTRADTALGAATVTDWGENPWHGGAYAYARPGHWQDRARLAEPLAGGRLVLAGEAYRTDGLAGTVAGAFLDGGRAAAIVRAALPRRA